MSGMEDAHKKRMLKVIQDGVKDALSQPPAPAHEAVAKIVTGYVESLTGGKPLSQHKVVCDESNNPPSDIAQGKLNVIMSVPMTPELAQSFEDWGIPLQAPYCSKFRDWLDTVKNSIADNAAETAHGPSGQLVWRLASRTSSVYMEFNQDETVRVWWRLDRIDAMFHTGPLKHEEVLPADMTIREIVGKVFPSIATVVQARWADAAADDICAAEDALFLKQVMDGLDKPDTDNKL